jgi:interferon, gamma-inducible protein 30
MLSQNLIRSLLILLLSATIIVVIWNIRMWLPVPMIALAPASPPPVVVVKAYTEALCIDCKNFIDHQLVPTYHKLGPSVMDLHIIPFGNAQLDLKTQTVTCQHGDGECDANSWEQCAVEKYSPKEYITFFGCLETTLPMGRYDQVDREAFHDCADLAFLDFDALAEKHDNPLYAYQLQQKYSKLTPPHDHVPWVVVNGKQMDEEQNNLMDVVCQEYAKGGGSHPACSKDGVEGKKQH